MKQLFLLVLLTACIQTHSYAQTFELKDSVFHTGAILNKQLLFDYDKSTIRTENKPFLDSMAIFLIQHKNVTLEIGNHCDERFSKQYSTCLTCKRAQAIVDYLITKGMDKNRLVAKGYNAEKPIIVHAKTEEEHSINRRTEFKILSINP